jgi:RNase P subunit RPR2
LKRDLWQKARLLNEEVAQYRKIGEFSDGQYLSLIDFANSLECLRCHSPLAMCVVRYPETELHSYTCQNCGWKTTVTVGVDFLDT